jgi:hypothetical protein
VRLKVHVGVDGVHVVQEHVVHRCRPGTQVLGPIDDADGWIVFLQPIANCRAVGVDDNLVDWRTVLEGIENVVEERAAGEVAKVFAGHALAVVPHRDESNEARR